MLEPRSPHLRWRQNRVLQPPSPPRASLPHRGVLAVFDTLPMAGKIPCWGQGGLRAAGIPPVLAIIVLLAESSAP